MPRPPDLPKDWIYAEKSPGDLAAPICDFCSGPRPTWSYPCRQFMMGIMAIGSPTQPDSTLVHDFNDDGWGACDTCAADIEAGRWAAIATRAVANGNAEDPERARLLGEIIATAHQNFRIHRYGSRTRITT
jgi:hypothetical protein